MTYACLIIKIKPPLVKKEIERRSLITSSWMWSDVNNHKIKNGMNLCAVLATLGKPDSVNSGKLFLELNYTSGQTVALSKKDVSDDFKVY